MTAKIDILSFDAGLVDDLVESRATVINHGRGCRQIINLIPMPQGPAISRPPSRYMASTKGHGQARFLTVVYSESLAFLCEFGNLYVRFFTNSGQVLSGAAAYEIPTPYTIAYAATLQAFNDAGTLYLAGGARAPTRLVYAGTLSWTLAAIPITWGPFADENDSAITITPSAVSGAGITLTASSGIFLAGHLGAQWRIGHRVGETALNHTFITNATSATLAAAKDAALYFVTHGTWNGTLILEKSYDSGGTWEAVLASLKPAEDNNFDEELSEDWDDAIYRIRMTGWVSGSSCQATLTVDPHVAYGYCTITRFTSATAVTATVVDAFAMTAATEIWSEGAWSGVRGWPRAVGLVDNRLSFAGTTADPTTIWMSYTNQYTIFRSGVNPADALTFTFTTRKGDPFLWILGEQYSFYVGTPSAILEISAADPRSAISLTNKPEITRRLDFGSSAIQPVRAHGTILFTDPSTLIPMHKQYDWEQDLMLSPSLAFDCPTITEPGIKRILFQRGRVPIVWWLRTDGVLLGMSFTQRFRENIIGWQITETDGIIDEIGILPGGTGGDRLWWIAARTVNGATVRHVERLDVLDLQPTRAAGHRLDGYIEFDGGAAKTITGLAVDAGTGRITITAASHGFLDGQQADFMDVGGMAWLNGQTLTAADAATHTFTLKTLGGNYIDGRVIGTYTSGGTVRRVENRFAGLDHLEGRSVYAVADGRVLGPYTVTTGEITISRYSNRVFAGLPSTWTLQPLRLVLPTPDGSTRGRQQRLSGVWLSVYRSWECHVGRDADHLQLLRFGETVDTPNEVPELVTGDKYTHVEGGYTDDPTIVLTSEQPLPFCVRCLMLDTGIHGMREG